MPRKTLPMHDPDEETLGMMEESRKQMPGETQPLDDLDKATARIMKKSKAWRGTAI